MKYSELLNTDATPTEIQSFLVGSENVSVTLRMPRALRDAAKEAAALSGMSFTSYVKMCLINRLAGDERR